MGNGTSQSATVTLLTDVRRPVETTMWVPPSRISLCDPTIWRVIWTDHLVRGCIGGGLQSRKGLRASSCKVMPRGPEGRHDAAGFRALEWEFIGKAGLATALKNTSDAEAALKAGLNTSAALEKRRFNRLHLRVVSPSERSSRKGPLYPGSRPDFCTPFHR